MLCANAGKSTFLNSMLGDNLLPVHSEPCTARICQINHKQLADDEQPTLTESDAINGTVSTVATGSSNVLEYLTQLNDTERGNQGDSNERVVTITAQFAALADGLAGISTQTGMCVMDTPGVITIAAETALHAALWLQKGG